MAKADRSDKYDSQGHEITDALEEVVDKLSQATNGAKSLRESVEELKSAHRTDRKLLLAIVVMGMALVFIAWQNFQSARYLRECTTPGSVANPHACYNNSQQQTKRAIKGLIDAGTKSNYEQTQQIIKLLTGKDVSQQQVQDATPTTTTTTRANSRTTPTTRAAQPSPAPTSSPTTTSPSPATTTTTRPCAVFIAGTCVKGP